MRSSAASAAGWGEGCQSAPLASRIGHHASTILIACIGGAVLLGLHPLPGVFALTVPVALLVMVLGSWLLMRRHDRRLCEQCVAAMPLDASKQAARYQRRFWVAHTGSEPRFVVPYLVVLIGSNFLTSPAGRICWAAIQLTMAYLILSQSSHRRFQPWCPWCRAGGGGDEVDETPPVIPHDDRQLA